MTDDSHKDSVWPAAEGTLDIRDEFRLLLLCAHTRIEAQQREQIRALALKQLDWEFVVGKARSHGLIPLLYRNLNDFCADHVPPPVLQQLESDCITNTKRNLTLTAELIKVLRILQSAGISAVPYKGPALAALAYGDVKLRKFFDLDVVIRPQDVTPAKSLLISNGYQWRPMRGQITGRNEARNIKVWHEYNFIHPDSNAMIDLHWRISPAYFPFDIDLNEIWRRLEPARLLDADIKVFPPEALLLFLCVHGSKDLWWRRIGWICDIAQLLSASPDLDWSYSIELAKNSGAQRMLLLGLALARELLQAPVPEQICDLIRSDMALQPLIEQVRHRLFNEHSIRYPVLEGQSFRISVRERMNDRIPTYRHLIKTLFTMVFIPNRKDHEVINLPGALSPLYYLVRPVRLAQKLWSRTIRHGDTTS